jgi:hypothetical protein
MASESLWKRNSRAEKGGTKSEERFTAESNYGSQKHGRSSKK